MIGKINKKILLLAVVALLALFSAYILTKPAEQAKADSTNICSVIVVYPVNGDISNPGSKTYSVEQGSTYRSLFESLKVADFSLNSQAFVISSFSQGSFGGSVIDLDSVIFVESVTVYLNISERLYDITFKDGDIILGVLQYPYGTTLRNMDTSSLTPSKTGYTFKGWSYSSSTNDIVLNAPAGSVSTFYAVFEINQYTVTFKNDTSVLKTVTADYGSKASAIDLTGVSPERTGYTFKGWSKTNGGSVVNLANETITADTTYYAVFEINKYSITFNDGTSVLKTVTANYGTKASEINVSTLAPEKEGYTFKGWSKTNGGEVVDLSSVTINQSMAFFAVYEKQTFEIKFMDGETLLKTVTVDYGTNLSAISLTGVNTDKTGFTFRGWALSNGGTVVNSETYSVKSAVNFYAVYDVEGKATVVFKDGATSLKTVAVDLGTKASEIDISDLELEKNGYTFKGWARSENGIIVDLETVSVNEYTILYSVYEKNSTDTNLSSDNVAKIFGVVGLIALGAVLGGVLFKKRR